MNLYIFTVLANLFGMIAVLNCSTDQTYGLVAGLTVVFMNSFCFWISSKTKNLEKSGETSKMEINGEEQNGSVSLVGFAHQLSRK